MYDPEKFDFDNIDEINIDDINVDDIDIEEIDSFDFVDLAFPLSPFGSVARFTVSKLSIHIITVIFYNFNPWKCL